jgi:hypothetical protein
MDGLKLWANYTPPGAVMVSPDDMNRPVSVGSKQVDARNLLRGKKEELIKALNLHYNWHNELTTLQSEIAGTANALNIGNFSNEKQNLAAWGLSEKPGGNEEQQARWMMNVEFSSQSVVQKNQYDREMNAINALLTETTGLDKTRLPREPGPGATDEKTVQIYEAYLDQLTAERAKWAREVDGKMLSREVVDEIDARSGRISDRLSDVRSRVAARASASQAEQINLDTQLKTQLQEYSKSNAAGGRADARTIVIAGVSIILPVFNSKAQIAPTVDKLLKLIVPYENSSLLGSVRGDREAIKQLILREINKTPQVINMTQQAPELRTPDTYHQDDGPAASGGGAGAYLDTSPEPVNTDE